MARQQRTLRRLAVVGTALLLGSALGGGLALAASPAAPTKTTIVQLGDNFFQPKKVTVTAGTRVTWTWTGSSTHNVTVVSGPQKFHSGDQASGSYSRVMALPGVYHIVCTFHPGMDLTLTVKRAPKPRGTTTSAPPPSS